MRLIFRQSVLLLAVLCWAGVARAQSTVVGLHRAGDLLFHDPRTVSWLIQDRNAALGTRLSGYADLSSQMPTVGDQQSQGSCVAWSVGYYHMTHNLWLLHHWDVTQT